MVAHGGGGNCEFVLPSRSVRISPDRLGHAWYTRSLARLNTLGQVRQILHVSTHRYFAASFGLLMPDNRVKDECRREWVTDLVNGPMQ